MKTNILNPEILATDETRVKHGWGHKFEQEETEGTERQTTESPRHRTKRSSEPMWGRIAPKWEEAVGIHDFCRVRVGFYRIIYRILPHKSGFLPPLAACYRLLPHNVFFGGSQRQPNFGQGNDWQRNGQAELGTNMEKECSSFGVLGAELEAAGAKICEKIWAFIGSFHALSDIIAQNRPVLSRFLAFYRSGLFTGKRYGLGLGGGAWENASFTNRMAGGCDSSLIRANGHI